VIHYGSVAARAGKTVWVGVARRDPQCPPRIRTDQQGDTQTLQGPRPDACVLSGEPGCTRITRAREKRRLSARGRVLTLAVRERTRGVRSGVQHRACGGRRRVRSAFSTAWRKVQHRQRGAQHRESMRVHCQESSACRGAQRDRERDRVARRPRARTRTGLFRRRLFPIGQRLYRLVKPP
jgi:hypothetical protein